MTYHYIRNGETLTLDSALCNGCRECVEVCPHAVFSIDDGKCVIRDRAVCMECGACARNCARGALSVKAGVGCAAAIIGGMLRGTQPTCGDRSAGPCAGETSSRAGSTVSSASSSGCCGGASNN